jgi:hypothetical protein
MIVKRLIAFPPTMTLFPPPCQQPNIECFHLISALKQAINHHLDTKNINVRISHFLGISENRHIAEQNINMMVNVEAVKDRFLFFISQSYLKAGNLVEAQRIMKLISNTPIWLKALVMLQTYRISRFAHGIFFR